MWGGVLLFMFAGSAIRRCRASLCFMATTLSAMDPQARLSSLILNGGVFRAVTVRRLSLCLAHIDANTAQWA
jgi:hypothetical protein